MTAPPFVVPDYAWKGGVLTASRPVEPPSSTETSIGWERLIDGIDVDEFIAAWKSREEV